MSDYLQEGEAGFKKPKVRHLLSSRFAQDCPADFLPFASPVCLQQKKKKRPTRVADADFREESGLQIASTSTLPTSSDLMQVDSPAVAAPPSPPATENFIDDDDLQAALAAARRKRSKKVVKLTPEDIARQRQSRVRLPSSDPPTDLELFLPIFAVAEQKAEEETRIAVEQASRSAEQVQAEDGTIQFDDTSEFVRSIAIPEAPAVKVVQIITKIEPDPVASSSTVKAEEEDVDLNALVGDVDMEGGDEEEEGDDLLGETALAMGLSIEEMRIKADKDLAEAEAAEALAVSRFVLFLLFDFPLNFLRVPLPSSLLSCSSEPLRKSPSDEDSPELSPCSSPPETSPRPTQQPSSANGSRRRRTCGSPTLGGERPSFILRKSRLEEGTRTRPRGSTRIGCESRGRPPTPLRGSRTTNPTFRSSITTSLEGISPRRRHGRRSVTSSSELAPRASALALFIAALFPWLSSIPVYRAKN